MTSRILRIYKPFPAVLTYLFGLFLGFFIPSTFAFGQNNDRGEIRLSFAKESDSIRSSELYFNILKISNFTKSPIIGDVSFSGPESWNIIAFPSTNTTINAGDSLLLPVRISPSADAIGGITYILSGTFRSTEKIVTKNTYLTLPSKPKWDFSTNKSSIYFNQHNPNTSFQVFLTNKGNTNELIKINLKIGRLLWLQNATSEEFTQFVELPAFKDTIITYVVSDAKGLSFNDRARYENNWKESSILATASTESLQRTAAVMIRKLNSSYANRRSQIASPLNIDYQVFNLMSGQEARYNAKLYGSILFPNRRDLQYVLGLNNMYFSADNNEKFNMDKQFIYSLRYSDKKSNLLIGYNVHGGDMHAINGRGITGNYLLGVKNKISYAFLHNTSSESVGGYLDFSTSIKKISFNIGTTHETTLQPKYAASSVLVGFGFGFFRYNTISLQFLGSKATYSHMLVGNPTDTSAFGFSYRARYSIQYKKFELRLSGTNSFFNYTRNSGMQFVYLESKYFVNDRFRLILNGNRQDNAISNYPYNFYNTVYYNSNDYCRLTASLSGGSVVYQLGPSYNGSMRQYKIPLTSFVSRYTSYEPGIWAAATIKLSNYGSITPNITVNNLRFSYASDDTIATNFSWKNSVFYTVGINYYDVSLRVNAYYSSGSTTDLYRSMQVDVKPVLSRSIQFRPSYEKYLLDRKVKLSAYMNYAYYMPSGRENISFNVKHEQFIKNGWSFFVSGFIYSTTRVDDEIGRISTKDLNLIAGVSKSFAIQQPRLKYYNFKAVFFNDLDGDLAKSKNEPPVPNIMVRIEKDRDVSKDLSTVPQVELISDLNGEILFENLPKDFYKLSLTPLVNLQSLYFINGSEQNYYNDKQRVLYIPLAESYKIKGKVVVVRDPNSSEGKIDLNGIRITAEGVNGETSSALTDRFGGYVLNVPKANLYKVRVNNVFGEQFSINADEMEVMFTQNKTINLDFTFLEKRREVQFDKNNEFFKFKSIKSDTIQ